MKKADSENRGALIRESLVFQLKLLADGARDVMLVPVALVATLVGLLRGGEDPFREFHQVIELGRKSEQWINLFGQHEPVEEAGKAGSIDMLLIRAEEVVREQTRQGSVTEAASEVIGRALRAAQRKASQADSRERGTDI